MRRLHPTARRMPGDFEVEQRLRMTHSPDVLSIEVQNRVFFPQEALDQWMIEGTIDLQGAELTILAEARRYRLLEAARIVREVTGAPDPHGLVGRVKSKAFLDEMGAEIVESSMILGENAYDVVPGWLGAPVGTFDEHVTSPARKRARAERATGGDEPKTDEDLRARFLMKNR
jgi:hypothetical protein